MTDGPLSRRGLLGRLAAIAGAGLVAAGCGAASVQSPSASASSSVAASSPSVGASATTAAPSSTTAAASSSSAATAANATSTVATTAAKASSATAVASATTSSVAPESIKVAPGTLNWWPGWPGTYMGDVANAFMKDNPTIKVEPDLFYPDNTKLVAAIVAGTGPDVVSDIGYYNFIERGAVLPIDDMLKTEKISTTDGDIRAANWNAFHWKGKYYGVPAVDTAGRGALGYNVDLVQAAGLDPDQPPQTWDDVYLWHQKLTKKDSSGNLTQLGMDPLFSRANATSDGDTWLWPEMWGFHYFDVNTMKYDIDRSETMDFYSTIQKFYDLSDPDKQAAFTKLYTKSYGAFGIGKQAMGITYPSGPGTIYKINPNGKYKWTWPPMPTSRKGIKMQSAAGHAQLLVKGSKLTDAGFKLALFVAGKTASDILFDQVGWVGPSKSWQKSMDLSKFPADVQQGIQFFSTSLDDAKEIWTAEMDPEDEFLGSKWRDLASQVNKHSIDTKTAAQQLQFVMTTQLNSENGAFK
jgi:maltose-binding protein MalE